MPIATNSDKIDLSSEKKTEELANKILKKLKVGDVVFFYGEIGVGKTTFIKYLINGFQKENKLKLTEVTSPTFTLLNEYQINHIRINHYDLFRLKSLEEIENLGLFENNKNLITVTSFNTLTTSLCKKNKATIIFRGLRAVSDFEYEFQLAGMNRKLDKSIETVFLMSDAEQQIISSKFVKEIAKLDGKISNFVTKSTIKAIKEKI